MKKVDFFIVGAAKAGTTSLYHYLNEHSDIEMSSQKEPDFFSDTSLHTQMLYYGKNRIDTIEKYHALFQQENVLRGDASVSYLFYEDVPKKIIKYNPNAKIVIMLRNPIDRAFSHYLMDYRLGLVSEKFETIIQKKSKHKYANLFYQQYIQVSEYTRQIKNYLNIFSKENICIIDYEDFKKNTSDVVNRVYIFLGVDNSFQPCLRNKYNTYSMPKNLIIRYIYSFVFLRKIIATILPKNLVAIIRQLLFRNKNKPQLSSETKKILKQHFENDVQELSVLLNKNFKKWIR